MNRPCLIAISMILAVATNLTGQVDDGIQFFPSLETARQSSSQPQPVVIYFSATWCEPCRQMKLLTFELLNIDAAAKRFLWVGVDIDESPDIATRYGVVAVPSLAVLDEADQLVGIQAGFIPAEDVVAFIEDALANPQPPVLAEEELWGRFLDETTSLDDRVDLLIGELADPRRQDRQIILESLPVQLFQSQIKPKELTPLLIQGLSHDDLRIRAAATELLSSIRGAQIDFDPFGSLTERRRAIAAIRTEIGN